MIIKSFTIRLNGISEEDFDEMLDVVKSYFEILKINKESRRIYVKPNNSQKMNMNYMYFIGMELGELKQKNNTYV